MLGDLNIAEPGALIGFAGPRVIEQTIRQSLPEGFQRSEFLLEHGFLDLVVQRVRAEGDARALPAPPDVRRRRDRSRPAPRRPGGAWASGSAWSAWRATCSRGWATRSSASPRSWSPAPTARARPRRSSPPWPSAAGYRTGLYTSPHLESVEERLRIDGRTIDPDRLGAPARAAWSASPSGRPELPPTYFEALTVAAFLGSPRRGSTSPCSRSASAAGSTPPTSADPILSLITPIGLDHQEYLGDTLAADRAREGGHPPLRPAGAGLDRGAGGGRSGARRRRAEMGADLRFASGGGADRGRSEPRRLDRPARPARHARRGAYDLQIALLGAHQATTWGSPCGPRRRSPGRGFDRSTAEAIARGSRRLPLAGPAGSGRAAGRPARAPRRRPQRRRAPPPSPDFLDDARPAGRPPLRRPRRQGRRGDARPARAATRRTCPHHPGEPARQGRRRAGGAARRSRRG